MCSENFVDSENVWEFKFVCSKFGECSGIRKMFLYSKNVREFNKCMWHIKIIFAGSKYVWGKLKKCSNIQQVITNSKTVRGFI